MRAQGVAHHKSTYDVLLRIYGKKGLLKTCDRLLEQMENSGISRDAHTFNLLIEGHAAKGAIAQCAALVEEMRAQGVAPDTHTYTTIMQACAENENYKYGIAAYERMRSERVPANILTYRAALACYGGMRAWDACVNLAADMEAQGVEPDARLYKMMLEVCARMGDARVTRALLEEMKRRNIEIGEDTRMALMAVFKDSNEIIRVSEEIVEKGREEDDDERGGDG